MKPRTSAKFKLRRQRKPPVQLKVSRSDTPPTDEEDAYHEDESHSMKLSHAFFVVLVLHLVLIGGIFGFNYIKARQIPPLLSAYKTPTTSHSKNSKDIKENSSEEKKSSASSTLQDSSSDSAIIPSNVTTSQQSQSSTDSDTTRFRTHRVSKGETLQRIAAAYGVTVSQLEKANNSSPISDGQLLRIPLRNTTIPPTVSTSNEVRKPASEVVSVTRQPAPAKPTHKSAETTVKGKTIPQQSHSTAAKEGGIHGAQGAVKTEANHKIYVVVAGDNPYSIARRFKISYAQLLKFNHIEDPTKLQIGTKLKIPTKP